MTLSVDERHDLAQLIRKGKAAARTLAHARVVLRADESESRKGRPDEEIAATLPIGLRTIAPVPMELLGRTTVNVNRDVISPPSLGAADA